MKKLALLLVVLALFVAPAVAGTVTIVADPLMVDTGDPAQLKVQFWVEDFTPLLGGIDWRPLITHEDGTDWTSSFTVNYDESRIELATWLFYDVSHNIDLYPVIIPFVTDPPSPQNVGFIGLLGDKAVFANTWLFTINYNYTQLPIGIYTIAFDPEAIGLVNTDGQITGYEVVNGTFSVVPEPCTMALLGCGLVGLLGYGRKRIRK